MRFLSRVFAVLLALGLAAGALSSCTRDPDIDDLADFTVIIYGNSGGSMDNLIEKAWEDTRPLIVDRKVRVIVVYKYGQDSDEFAGKYGNPGELVAFELDKDTNLEEVHNEGAEMKQFSLYDPKNLQIVLDVVKQEAPARDYVLVLYGHGGGFNPSVDFPKERYDLSRGVLYDELLDYESMNMYELTTAIETSQIPHLKGLFFHNCLMGGMESMVEVAPYTDYIIATPFMLEATNNPLITNLVWQLRKTGDFEAAARQALSDSQPVLYKGHLAEDQLCNGNVELLKADALDGVCDAAKALSARLCALYPSQREAIDKATGRVYQFNSRYSYYDLLDYARQAANETGDAQLQAIQTQMATAFDRAILHQITIDTEALPALPAYSLSVVLVDSERYHKQSAMGSFTINRSYELTDFHIKTGWGKWLDTNLCAPRNNPHGQ